MPRKPRGSTEFLQRRERILNKRTFSRIFGAREQGGNGPLGASLLHEVGLPAGQGDRSCTPAREGQPVCAIVKGEWQQLTDFLASNSMTFL